MGIVRLWGVRFQYVCLEGVHDVGGSYLLWGVG